MSDKVFPASKPTPSAAANGGPAPTTAAAAKTHLLNPTARVPYRQPHNRRHHNRPRRNYCCCLCFWAVLIILILALLAAIAGAAVYITYRPHRPAFTVASLRINRLKLTAAGDASSSHLSTLFNLTLSSKNPNSRISFSYDPFAVSVVSVGNGVVVGNGTLPAFLSSSKNGSTFRGVAVSATSDLDADSVNKLRSDLKQRTGSIGLKIQMDTRVEVKMEKMKSKKVGIRVVCDGIRGVVPKGKSPAAADVSAAKCTVDLRIKIWKWTF